MGLTIFGNKHYINICAEHIFSCNFIGNYMFHFADIIYIIKSLMSESAGV